MYLCIGKRVYEKHAIIDFKEIGSLFGRLRLVVALEASYQYEFGKTYVFDSYETFL